MAHQQITFRVSYAIAQAVIAWQQMVSWHIIAYQINTFGLARIVRYKDRKRFSKLDAIPDFGTAEPYYGTVGGGYRYSFQPESEGSCCPFRGAFRALVVVTRMTLLLMLTNKSFLWKQYKCPFHGAHIRITNCQLWG